MVAYEKYFIVDNPGEVVLSDVPVRAGQRVKVVVTVEEDVESRRQDLLRLLKETQVLPQSQTITEQEIADEIAAYRATRS